MNLTARLFVKPTVETLAVGVVINVCIDCVCEAVCLCLDSSVSHFLPVTLLFPVMSVMKPQELQFSSS